MSLDIEGRKPAVTCLLPRLVHQPRGEFIVTICIWPDRGDISWACSVSADWQPCDLMCQLWGLFVLVIPF